MTEDTSHIPPTVAQKSAMSGLARPITLSCLRRWFAALLFVSWISAFTSVYYPISSPSTSVRIHTQPASTIMLRDPTNRLHDVFNVPVFEPGRALSKELVNSTYDEYWTYARHSDDLRPITRTGLNWTSKNTPLSTLHATMVDTLDTLYIMNLTEPLERSIQFLKSSLTFSRTTWVSTFEITIRVLGGLLAAYDFSDDPWFLTSALDLGRRLGKAYRTSSGIPSQRINLKDGRLASNVYLEKMTSLADSSLSLEFTWLDRSLEERKHRDPYFNVNTAGFDGEEWTSQAEYVISWRYRNQWKGLIPQFFHIESLRGNEKYSAAGGADSYYEYQLKRWIMGGKQEAMWRENYENSLRFLMGNLLTRVRDEEFPGKVYTFFKEILPDGHDVLELSHLSCFAPGMLVLDMMSTGKHDQAMLDVAHELAETCYEMYVRYGVAPEQVRLPSFEVTGSYSLLRPELVESLYYLYSYTGDPIYRSWAYTILQNLRLYAMCSSKALCSLSDVRTLEQEDRLESFVLSETLKYLWLIFGDRSANLRWLATKVWTTEAHGLSLFAHEEVYVDESTDFDRGL